MGLGRRKSGLQADIGPDEAESATPRARNRLSKPRSLNQALKSSNSLARLAAQKPDLQKEPESTAVDPGVHPTKTEDLGKPATRGSVTELINRLEATQSLAVSPSQQSLLSIPKRKPSQHNKSLTSMTDNKRLSLSISNSSSNSRDKLTVLKNDSRTSLSPAPSFDDTSDKPRFSRRSSFVPGAATRKSSVVERIEEEKEPVKFMALDQTPQTKSIDEDARSFNEGDEEDRLPPPQITRAETPHSLDYTHLGGLSLGSLKVVNGRASPTPSNMSKRLFMRRVTPRDVSSEYGDPDAGEQHHRGFLNGDSVYSVRNRQREFSWQSNGSSKLANVDIPPLPRTEASGPDPASFLASEYMAELRSSPYAERKFSWQRQTRQSAPMAYAQPHRSTSISSMRSYESLDATSDRSSSPVPSIISETGSVLVITSKRTESDDQLFEDEALGRSPTKDRESPESWHSWTSPADLRLQSNQGFQTALEYAHPDGAESDPTCEPTISSTSHATADTVLLESAVLASRRSPHGSTTDTHDFVSIKEFQSPLQIEPSPNTVAGLSPDQAQTFHKSDSGYSSNVSVRSTSAERQKAAKAPVEHDRRSFVEKVFRPILKSRKTAPEVPTFANIQPASLNARPSSIIIQPVEKPEKLRKQRKLTKRLTSGAHKQPIVLQTIQSIDSLSIPPVSMEAQANLRIRSQAVPELQSTYSSMDHVRNNHSLSTIAALDETPEIRFPSPEPEKPSKQRRSSWFGRSKDIKPKSPNKRYSQEASGISQQHAMSIVNDWEAVAPSLGGSHYDQIPSRRDSLARQQSQRSRHRSMMDDKTAAELARYRSSSIRERDAWNARAASFNDRGGTPGETYRPASLVLNMPPMPCKPFRPDQEHEREALPAPRAAHPPPPTHNQASEEAPPPPPHSTRPSSVNHDYDEEPVHAPPPPPHSPQPMYLEGQDYFEEPEDHFDASAPPPPSHSPRPMDVSDQDPWAAQAARWSSHRQHAVDYHEAWNAVDQRESLYPAIPPRQSTYAPTRVPEYYESDTYYHPRAQKRHTFDIHQQHYTTHSLRDTSYYDQQHYHGFYEGGVHNTRSPQGSHVATPNRSPRGSQTHTPYRSPYASQTASRNHSPAPSHRSRHSLLPPDLDDMPPQLPPPDFGRFTGGFEYQYDGENGGVGGSAGTRDGSRSAQGDYKGVALREGWGVDLGDVPVSLQLRM